MNSPQISSEVENQISTGFCIYVDTLVEGWVPVEWTEVGNPLVCPTREVAERAIAENTVERIRQFLGGEREFGDAMTVEEHVVEVDIQSDGSIIDESGRHFGKHSP